MDAKSMSAASWSDFTANLAQQGMERMREMAAQMQSELMKQAQTATSKMGEGFSGKNNKVAEYMQAKPMQASLIAMAVSLWASRVLKPKEEAAGATEAAPVATKTARKTRRRTAKRQARAAA